MEFKVSRDLFHSAIQKITTVLSSGVDELEAFLNIWITVFNGMIYFSASNRKMSAQVQMNGNVSADNVKFGVPGSLFKNIINALQPGQDLLLQVNERGMVISSGNISFNLNIFTPDSCPPFPHYDAVAFQKTNYEEFLKGLRKVAFSSGGKDADRTYCEGLCINKDHFVATDGHRMAVYPNNCVKVTGPALVPQDAALRLLKLYVDMKEGGVAFDQGVMHMVSDGVYATARLLNAQYPNYGSIIPQNTSRRCIIGKNSMLTALRRVLLINTRSPMIDFSFSPHSVTLELSSEAGRAKETVSCETSTPEQMCLNGKFLADSLTHMDSESVLLELRGEAAPLIIKEGGYINVVMPIAKGS